MEELFLKYYWLAPAIWIVITISNRLLGILVAKLNQKTVGYIPPTNEGQWGVVYIIRLALFIPGIIYVWWFFTSVIALGEIFLLVAGYQLLLWTTAVIRQLANLLSHSLFQKLQFAPPIKKDNLEKAYKLQSVTLAGEYFSYFLIYLLITILTQSWFIAGGVLSCLVNAIRYVNKVQKTTDTLEQVPQDVKEPEA